jgi:predicted acyltransferase (DUF342 family)
LGGTNRVGHATILAFSLPAHTLTIGPQAEVKADISAKEVVVAGAVTGKVLAGNRIEIRATGSVTGDVTSPDSSSPTAAAFAAWSR